MIVGRRDRSEDFSAICNATTIVQNSNATTTVWYSLLLSAVYKTRLRCFLWCHETISTLKGVNDDLNAKLEIANKSNSCVEHVKICNRCKDFNIDACSEHLVCISKLNDEVASLNAQLKTSKSDFDKLKFARDAYTVGRHPSIKDGLGFKREAKNLTSHKAPIPIKEKGKAPIVGVLGPTAHPRLPLTVFLGVGRCWWL